uniref:Mediator of RNA polymerase II transcription subunit 15 n=1 Tax=Ditylenchus dipsaci TaxID=166011 RepID=A0A915D2L7_9BILA
MQQQHQQHRGWNNMQQQPNPQMVSTGGYSQPISGPNGTFQPSMEQGYGGVQHGFNPVANSYIDYGHLSPDIVRQLKGLGEEEKPYYEKICQLQMYTNMLHDRAKTFQMDGYGQMVNRIEYALAMLRFERIGNLEHARGIETLIRKLAQQNVSAQPNAHQQQYMHQQQQPPQQMMDNPMAYPQHQMASHQQQWQGWQQHQPPPQDTVGKPQSQTVAPVSGGGPIQPTSQQQHHPYISPSSSASYSAANRPAPYPLPSHQPNPRYSNAAMQQQHYQNVGYGPPPGHMQAQQMGMSQQHQPQMQQPHMMRQGVAAAGIQLNPIMSQSDHMTNQPPNQIRGGGGFPISDPNSINMADNTSGGYTAGSGGLEEMYLYKSAPDATAMDDLLPVPNEGPQTATSSSSNNQSGGGNSMDVVMGSAGSTINAAQLPESVRSELMSMEKRFLFDPDVEMTQEAFAVRCSLRREQVPSMVILVPRNYPVSAPRAEQTPLDLDAFYYEDLQNAIHDQLNKMAPRSIIEILNIWDAAVQKYHNSSTNFDFASSNAFGDAST